MGGVGIRGLVYEGDGELREGRALGGVGDDGLGAQGDAAGLQHEADRAVRRILHAQNAAAFSGARCWRFVWRAWSGGRPLDPEAVTGVQALPREPHARNGRPGSSGREKTCSSAAGDAGKATVHRALRARFLSGPQEKCDPAQLYYSATMSGLSMAARPGEITSRGNLCLDCRCRNGKRWCASAISGKERREMYVARP